MKVLKAFLFFIIISSASYAEVVNSVLVVVDNIPITTIDFLSRKKYLTTLAAMEKKKITDKEVYDDLIKESVLNIKAKEYNITVTDREIEREMDRIRKANNITDLKTFESVLEKQGMSIAEYKKSIRKQIIIQNLYGVAIQHEQVTDEEADAYYAKSKGDERKYFEADTAVEVGLVFLNAKTFGEKKEKTETAAEVFSKLCPKKKKNPWTLMNS